MVLFVSLISCEEDSNVRIKNKILLNEINLLISRLDDNKPCKSEYLVVQFEKDEIDISNTEPFISQDLIGVSYLNKSKIYFYSKNNYFTNYISINFKITNFKIDKNYSCGCEPPMGTTLLIYENDSSKLTKWSLQDEKSNKKGN
jgi:hypothetical protein